LSLKGVAIMTSAIGVVLASAVYFVWSAISWMALSWQRVQFKPFANENDIAEALDRAAPRSGIYGLPAEPNYPSGATEEQRQAIDTAAYERLQRGPIVFAVIARTGYPSYARMLVLAFLTNVVVFAGLAWMLAQTTGLGYAGRVSFVALFAAIAGAACRIPDWNWHKFPLAYTLVAMANLTAGSLLAGLVLALFVRGR
jgi:hypothetical protein